MKERKLFLLTSILFFLFTGISCKKDKPAEIVKDFDGNIYHTVKIGSQTWMVENLKTTHLNTGEPITEIKNDAGWGGIPQVSFCWYQYDESSYKTPYGGLYNKLAVETGKLAPYGWRVPTNEDWDILIDYLGGATVAGEKMKETGTAHWLSASKSTNESGFTGIGSGSVTDNGFFFFKNLGFYLTATQPMADETSMYILSSGGGNISKSSFAGNAGYSVRCIKGNPQ